MAHKGPKINLKDCHRCSLRDEASMVVPAEGNENANIMIVGRNPGNKEDKAGRPFVGPGGKFLDKMIEILNLGKREGFYITNLCKCYSTGDRPPTDDEINICKSWLLEEIKRVKPLVVFALGKQVAIHFLNEKYGQVTIYHRRVFYHRGLNIFVIPLYHPGYSVRNPRAAAECLEDMEFLNERIPILFEYVTSKSLMVAPRMFTSNKDFENKFGPYLIDKLTS